MNKDQVTDDNLKRIESKLNKEIAHTDRAKTEKNLEVKNIKQLRNKQS